MYAQPNKSVPVYRVKPIGEGKERVLHRNLLLPLGIKFVPEIESDSDSDHEEEPELEICQVERQISEGKPQATSVENMTPLADLEHGQGIVDSKLDSIVTPVDHVEPVEQGSMAPPVVISTDNLIDSQMSLDPKLLVPIDETVGSIPTQLTNLPSENSDDSLVLPSAKENSDSLMKTEEFLDFVDDLSQKPSSVIEKEKTCHTDIAPSIQVDETSHSLVQESKPETSPSSNESELIEAQDISSIEVPKENGSVDSTDISITESQFSSTMPYCEESLVAKIDPMGTNQFLSAQPCHKEDTASAHESVNLTMEKGNSISDTEVSASDAFDSKIPANDINAKFDSVSDSKVDESHIDHDKVQSIEKSIVNEVPVEPSESSKPIESPPKVRRSTRSTKGIPPTRYGSVTSHKVNASKRKLEDYCSISKKIDC